MWTHSLYLIKISYFLLFYLLKHISISWKWVIKTKKKSSKKIWISESFPVINIYVKDPALIIIPAHLLCWHTHHTFSSIYLFYFFIAFTIKYMSTSSNMQKWIANKMIDLHGASLFFYGKKKTNSKCCHSS